MPGPPSLEEVAGRRIPIPGAPHFRSHPRMDRAPRILLIAIGLIYSEQALHLNTVSIANWDQSLPRPRPSPGAHTLERRLSGSRMPDLRTTAQAWSSACSLWDSSGFDLGLDSVDLGYVLCPFSFWGGAAARSMWGLSSPTRN